MILSVDMGLTNYGVSVWDQGKPIQVITIQTKRKKKLKGRIANDLVRRHSELCDGLTRLIKKHKPKLMVGELPSFGSQSSDAAVAMTMAITTTLTLCKEYNLPALWHSPEEIKKFYTGDVYASKQAIMNKVCKHHGWDITFKQIKDKTSSLGFRQQAEYHVLGQKLPKKKFEHIADSIAAYYTAKHFHEKG